MSVESAHSHKDSGKYQVTNYFKNLKDPRRRHRRLHSLQDIVVMALCAVIAGAQDWQEIALFGRERRDWFKRFLQLPHGIPSHDTFERVFDRLAPQAFQACFRQWVEAIQEALSFKHIALDGKTLRGSGSGKLGPLHLVSAWASAQRLSLGQVATSEKSNEITAIPLLLDLLDLHGALVTIDAMGCQKAIAQKIVDGQGDYVLTVKENQGHLLEDIQQSFVDACEKEFVGLEHDTFETREKGHGREEYRCYTVLHHTGGLRGAGDWKNLTTIGMCYSERTVNGVKSEESRYFIGSRKASAKVYGKALREHWGIENSLHWQLDVTFDEDRNRVSKRNGAENLALLRRLTLSLLQAHPEKLSIAKKRFAAAINPDFLEEILRGDGVLAKR
jgi:predicted transposase YbfD/YdcC